MMKVAFVTDSGTGKNVEQLKEKGIFSLPLQISCDDDNLLDLEQLSIHDLYKKIRNEENIKTSLPPVGLMEEMFTTLKNEGYEMIFAIPICSGLSGTIQAMKMAASNVDMAFDYMDCYVTAVVQEYLITTAKELYEEGQTIEEIKVSLQKVIDSCDTLILPDDLQHLKRGGRLTPLAAALAGLLKIKPFLRIDQETEGKIDVVDKVRTMNKAMDKVISYMKEHGVDDSYMITVAHADDEKQGFILQNKIKEAFPGAEHNFILLVSVVAVHTGIGAQCIQYFKKLER